MCWKLEICRRHKLQLTHFTQKICVLVILHVNEVRYPVICPDIADKFEELSLAKQDKNNNKVLSFNLSHNVITCDVDREVSNAYCLSSSGDKVDW